MKRQPNNSVSTVGPVPVRHRFPRRRRESGFTMVEIALSLAIIGFALVAIIGVLPAGMTVQQQNREETIVNADAKYWMDAIRSGAQGLNDLPFYVSAITNVTTQGNQVTVNWYTPAAGINGVRLTDGRTIIGLLSTPKYYLPPGSTTYQSNYVTAYVRALSGPISDKFPQSNPDVLDTAFSYRMAVEIVPQREIVPLALGDRQRIAPSDPGLGTNFVSTLRLMQDNLYEIRLFFRWPLQPNGQVGVGRLTFRSVVGGRLGFVPDSRTKVPTFFFFEPHDYQLPQ